MFSKIINHQDVDSEVKTSITSPIYNIEKSTSFQNQFDTSDLNSAEIDQILDNQDSSFDTLSAIQKVTDLTKEKLNTVEIFKKSLLICKDFLLFNSTSIVLNEKEQWHYIFEKKKSEFEVLLKGLEKENTIEWLLKKQTFILIQPKEYGVTEKSSIYPGKIFIFPFSIGPKKGLCFFHIADEELDVSFSALETVKILLNQMALIINEKNIGEELEQKKSLNEKLKTKLIQASKLALAGELARGVTHEINNPLQIILGKLQLNLMNNGENDILKTIENQSLRIASLVKEVFNITIEPKNASEIIDLNFLIEKTVELVKCQMTKRGIEIYIIKTDNISGFIGNSIYLKRILLNLLLNAKKRMGQGSSLSIITGMTKDGMAKIEIEDTGAPISGLNSSDLFLQNENYNFEELDINLLSLDLMIKEMDGNLSFNSDGSHGNKVIINLPVNNQKELTYERAETS